MLFCLADAQSSHMSLIEVCSTLQIPRSKAFSVLKALQEFGLVDKDKGGKGYSLGSALLTLSRQFLKKLDLPLVAQPVLEDLAKETSNTAILGLKAGNEVFIAAKREGEASIAVAVPVGFRRPLTYGATGKAIVAFMPRKERAEILKDCELYFYGDPAKLDMGILRKDLARCRKDGFAEDLGETCPGLNVVAAPVVGSSGIPVGFVQIAVLFHPDVAHGFAPSVARAGKRISRELGADVDKIFPREVDKIFPRE